MGGWLHLSLNKYFVNSSAFYLLAIVFIVCTAFVLDMSVCRLDCPILHLE